MRRVVPSARARPIALAAIICGAMPALYACENPGQPDAVVPVVGVKVTPQSIQFVAVGETRTLSATVLPANATDRALTWESSDSTIATVDASGVVTAKAVGFDVFVTAVSHDGHHEASVAVNVNPG